MQLTLWLSHVELPRSAYLHRSPTTSWNTIPTRRSPSLPWRNTSVKKVRQHHHRNVEAVHTKCGSLDDDPHAPACFPAGGRGVVDMQTL